MRVAFDARSYFMRTGIARYTRGLVHAIAASGAPHALLFLISDQHQPDEIDFGDAAGRIAVRHSRAPWLGGEAERDVLTSELLDWRADLFHAVFPPHGLAAVPTLATIFDFSPLSHPGVHQDLVRDAFADAWRSARRDARGFLPVSQATDTAVVAEVGPERPRWIVPCGLSAPFDAAAPDASAPRRGVLHVGTIEPRKNVRLLLEACRRLADRGRPVPLTLVGKRGWGYPEFEAELEATPGARWLGFVDDQTVLAAYRSAAVAAFPSALEGFGLPVLEAMAQGALPLVAPDPALVDLVAEPALVVPPTPDAWADALARWLAPDADPARAALVSRTQPRARTFTWPQAAATALDAYTSLGPRT